MPKTCYYEVLGVESTANNDELKKAYKKCALRWHPDKNIGDEDAHTKFLNVKEAFTVLSDPHERSWYDKHKDQILSDGTEEINYFDVYSYFSATCFKGYNDSENGFYTVYRTVFENIAADDEAVSGKGNSSAPSFGTSESLYKDVVEQFYNYWSQYCTKLTFSWTDDKISRDYPRKVIRVIERSNQKKREKLQKERNEEVRNLVSFVRKRDKRVQAWRAEMEKEKDEKMQKGEDIRREQLLKNKRLNESYQECEWSKFSALEDELENVEKSLKEHFRENDESESDLDNSEEEDNKVKGFFCLPCHKMFQSEKAFENHEGSKKHKQNVAALANKSK